MGLILRSVKGSELTIAEMDGNLTYLAGTLSGSIQITGSIISDITGSGNFSSSISSTASFGTYLGDGSQLTGITGGGSGIFTQTGSFYATTNDLQITGSLKAGGIVGSSILIPGNSKFGASTIDLNTSHYFQGIGGDINMFAVRDSNSSDVLIAAGSAAGNDLTVTLGDVEDGNKGTKIKIDDAESTVQVTGSLSVDDDVNVDGILYCNGIGAAFYRSVSNSIILSNSSVETYIRGTNIQLGTLLSITASGEILASGDISSSADVYGVTGSFQHLLGDGSGLTNVTAEWDGSHLGNASITGSLTVTGVVSASGDMYSDDYFGGRIFASNYVNTPLISGATSIGVEVQNNLNVYSIDPLKGNITASGNISSSGTIYGNLYQLKNQTLATYAGNVLRLTDSAWDYIDINNTTVTIGGGTGDLQLQNITASGDISSSGDINAANIYSLGKLSADISTTTPIIKSTTSVLQVLDNLDVVGQITASGNISSSGDIYGTTGSFGSMVLTAPNGTKYLFSTNNSGHLQLTGSVVP